MTAARNIVAFTGPNRNGILGVQSARFMERLRPLGYAGHVIDLLSPEAGPRLADLLTEGVAFAWGYAGVGARLGRGEGNLWASAEVPFVSVLADPPFWIARNHNVASDWVVNGYVYADWLNYQRKHVRSAQVSGLVPMGVMPNPDRAAIPWERRPVAMAYVKTGSDPAKHLALWAELPRRIGDALREAAAILLDQPTGDIVNVSLATFRALGLHVEESGAMLHGMLQELDLYVRAERATRVARALLPLPVEIHGDGWEHLSAEAEDARAVFRPAFHAAGLDPFFATCRWLVNASPNFSAGAHERVLRGMAAGCAVASDLNDHARAHLARLPGFRGFEWTDPDLTDRLADALRTPVDADGLEAGVRYVERHHDPLAFMRALAELADVARARTVFAAFAPEAA